jgi:hypothetical protein
MEGVNENQVLPLHDSRYRPPVAPIIYSSEFLYLGIVIRPLDYAGATPLNYLK